MLVQQLHQLAGKAAGLGRVALAYLGDEADQVPEFPAVLAGLQPEYLHKRLVVPPLQQRAVQEKFHGAKDVQGGGGVHRQACGCATADAVYMWTAKV